MYILVGKIFFDLSNYVVSSDIFVPFPCLYTLSHFRVWNQTQFAVGQPHTHTGYKMSISPSPFSTPTKLLQKAEGSLAHYDVSIPMVTHNAGEVEPTI